MVSVSGISAWVRVLLGLRFRVEGLGAWVKVLASEPKADNRGRV